MGLPPAPPEKNVLSLFHFRGKAHEDIIGQSISSRPSVEGNLGAPCSWGRLCVRVAGYLSDNGQSSMAAVGQAGSQTQICRPAHPLLHFLKLTLTHINILLKELVSFLSLPLEGSSEILSNHKEDVKGCEPLTVDETFMPFPSSERTLTTESNSNIRRGPVSSLWFLRFF